MRTPRWSARRGFERLTGAGIALAMVATNASVAVAMPGAGHWARMPAALLAGLTPESAEVKRKAIRDSVQSDVDAGNFSAAADKLLENAKLLGDPVTLIEASEMYTRQAEKDVDDAVCEQADEAARVALDILHFYDEVASGKASTTWRAIDPASAGDMISQADALIGSCEEKVAALATPDTGEDGDGATVAAGPGKAPKKAREKKPGTGFIVGGAVATAIGVGGVSLVIAGVVIGNGKQKEVEDLDPTLEEDQDQIDTLDDEGARANLLAFIGAGVGVVGLAVEFLLLIVGAKKRKAGAPPANAGLRVVPMLSRTSSGLSISGRF